MTLGKYAVFKEFRNDNIARGNFIYCIMSDILSCYPFENNNEWFKRNLTKNIKTYEYKNARNFS